jgi:hypothetical protein
MPDRSYGVLDDVHPVQPMLRAALSTGRGSYNTLPMQEGRRAQASLGDLYDADLSWNEDGRVNLGGFDSDTRDVTNAGSSAEGGAYSFSSVSVHLIPQLVALHPLGLPEWQGLNQVICPNSFVVLLSGLCMFCHVMSLLLSCQSNIMLSK